MGNLLSSLGTVAESMRATQRAIEVTSNNVTNAKTPGYVKNKLDLVAKRFDVNGGFAGGVEAGQLLSYRKNFLEQGVQQQSHRYGQFNQTASSLERLEPILDIANGSGIGGALDGLFQSFSAWSVNPNDTPVRQAVLDRARDVAQGFQFTVASLATFEADGQNELRSAVEKINRIGAEIQKYNLEVRSDARKLSDPGLEAKVFSQLEELAEVVDFDTIRASDGSFTVNLGGQTPLTVGANVYPVSLDFSGAQVQLRNAAGQSVTSHVQQGKLKALLDVQNSFLPAVKTDLNRLAETVANRVNTTLAGGLDRNGNSPTVNLFSYDSVAGAAGTIAVNDLATSDLAGASAGAPGGNGNALALADLGRSREIDDFSFGQFFGNMAGKVGRALANARNDENTQGLLLSQARNLRASESEVSLDEEAANLVAYQRQYEANAELVRILNQLTETTINIIR